MNALFTEQSHVGDIVAQFPKAGDIFKANRIDFCCCGNRPIGEAAVERNIAVADLLNTLNSLYTDYQQQKQDVDWNKASYAELIDHIIHTHHDFLTEELSQLTPYVTKVYRVHGGHQPHLGEVYTLFHELKMELEQHTLKEEATVFPLILEYEQNQTKENLDKVLAAIDELEKEHDHAGNILKRLREITFDFTLPEGACRTYQMVYKRLEELEAETFQHVHLENNILFKRLSQQ
jgi:regulator of cell morphogenesis and NO signaling